MVRVILFHLFTGLLVLSCHGSWESALAQEFPYSAPRAPEFDYRGNYLGPGSEPPSSQKDSSHDDGQVRESRGRSYYTSVRPYAPQAPNPRHGSSSSPRRYEPTAPQRVPVEASTPVQPPPQVQPQPHPQPQPQVQQQPVDCSGYPMAIARARSQGEMQMIARQYLTCLLKTGWPQDQARQQVIKTIESTYAVTR